MLGGNVRWVNRLAASLAVSVLLCTLPALAQVDIDGLHLNANGALQTGYAGDFGSTGPSDHGLSLGGDGNFSGYYYNPSFASFSLLPYYGRSQSNSTSSSIQDSSGYNGNVNLFGGSYFPTSVSFGQLWNSTGNFGIPDSAGLTTDTSSRLFGVGTDIKLPGFPTVGLAYSQSSGTSSLYGSEGQSEASTRAFSVRSGYKVAGFNLSGSFSHLISEENSNILVSEGGTPDTEDTTLNIFTVSATHTLPLHGAFGAIFSRSDYDYSGSLLGENDTGVTDNATIFANVLVGRFPISSTVAYTDNLFGSVLQQSVNNGTPVYQTTLSPESRSLVATVSSSYVLLNRIFITGFVSRQDQYVFGQNFGVTLVGVNAAYHFGRRLKGLTVTLGMNDAANRAGNEGAGLVANVNYNNKFGAWDIWGNYNYNQSAQTLLAMYTISSMSYSGSARRRLVKGINWTVGGGGGRSGFVQQAGSGSRAESFSSSFSWHGYSLGGNYSISNGTSVLTPQGLVAEPVPIVSANELVVYNAKSYGVGATAAPVRNMSISVNYSDGTGATLGQSTTQGLGLNNSRTQLINGLFTYQFRKLNFIAGATRFRQNLTAPGAIPAPGIGIPGSISSFNTGMVTSYYFGISRWFKAF